MAQFAEGEVFGNKSQRHGRRSADHFLQMRQQSTAASINQIKRFWGNNLNVSAEMLLELLDKNGKPLDTDELKCAGDLMQLGANGVTTLSAWRNAQLSNTFKRAK